MLEDSIQTRGLVYLRKITGISRNHLADIFGYTPNSIARWEVDNRIPINALDTYNDLQTDFDRASEWLDDHKLMWDEVIPVRQAAMQLGISPYTMASLLARKKITPMNFGLLGNFVTNADVHLCRRP